jgi:hypothetical protein
VPDTGGIARTIGNYPDADRRPAGLLFTATAPAGIMGFPAGKRTCRRGVNAQQTIKIMGDKSPRSNQKRSTQKQAKANSAEQRKQQVIAAKQSAGKKN